MNDANAAAAMCNNENCTCENCQCSLENPCVGGTDVTMRIVLS